MARLQLTLDLDTEGGVTYADLRRFVELTAHEPDYYPLTFAFDSSNEELVTGIVGTVQLRPAHDIEGE